MYAASNLELNMNLLRFTTGNIMNGRDWLVQILFLKPMKSR